VKGGEGAMDEGEKEMILRMTIPDETGNELCYRY